MDLQKKYLDAKADSQLVAGSFLACRKIWK